MEELEAEVDARRPEQLQREIDYLRDEIQLVEIRLSRMKPARVSEPPGPRSLKSLQSNKIVLV